MGTIGSMKYVVCDIKGKQYLVRPNQEIEVDKLNGVSPFETDKVLLLVDDGNVQVGTPYLKQTLQFQILGNFKKNKIRIAKYRAKANYRRVLGFRAEVSRIKLADQTKHSVKST